MKRLLAFDSGVGGLSVLAPLFREIPGLHVQYLGDMAHLPYGNKSPTRVRDLTLKNLNYLTELEKTAPGEKSMTLVACNTASAQALTAARETLQEKSEIVGVIEASCMSAAKLRPQ